MRRDGVDYIRCLGCDQVFEADDLEADSLDVVELVMELEEVFDVVVPEEELADVKTVGQAFDLIMTKL